MKLEIPAQMEWDPNQRYVPTIDRPRIGMTGVFNLNWLSSLAEEWTLMMPLFGRHNFNYKELAFVDRKYEELA